MWYVNQVDRPFTTDERLGFILTMWYVNLNFVNSFLAIFSTFYINYVVCKLEFNLDAVITSPLFYINYVVCKLDMQYIVI